MVPGGGPIERGSRSTERENSMKSAADERMTRRGVRFGHTERPSAPSGPPSTERSRAVLAKRRGDRLAIGQSSDRPPLGRGGIDRKSVV